MKYKTLRERVEEQQVSHNDLSQKEIDKKLEDTLQNFGMVENAYVRLIDEDTGEELVRFDLTEDFSTETALVVAEIYKRDGQWKFAAIGSGYDGGLKALCKEYGIDAE